MVNAKQIHLVNCVVLAEACASFSAVAYTHAWVVILISISFRFPQLLQRLDTLQYPLCLPDFARRIGFGTIQDQL